MSLNLKPGVGERGQRVFNFPISARADFVAGQLVGGRAIVDASKFKAVAGRVLAQAQVTSGSLSGTLEFYDVTDGEVQLLSEVVDTLAPQTFETALTLDFSVPRIIEVRAGLDIGPSYTVDDALIVWFSAVELTTIF